MIFLSFLIFSFICLAGMIYNKQKKIMYEKRRHCDSGRAMWKELQSISGIETCSVCACTMHIVECQCVHNPCKTWWFVMIEYWQFSLKLIGSLIQIWFWYPRQWVEYRNRCKISRKILFDMASWKKKIISKLWYSWLLTLYHSKKKHYDVIHSGKHKCA